MSAAVPRPQRVRVEAAARLHFGVLDLRGHRGRRFGGIGAAVPSPSVALEAERADQWSAQGPDSARALEFARRFTGYHRITGGGRIRIQRTIPPHVGLGSGTQLGLAVARALAELYDLDPEPSALALAVGRGQRSAIGTWTFALGGFILEGGRQPGSSAVAPLLARMAIPAAWRCIVAIPHGAPGLSGEAEAEAFDRLPEPGEREVERVAHLVLMQMLPALADEDLPTFGAALSELQRITGSWFSAAQGGEFAHGKTRDLVERLKEWGATGVGQSSWGPTVYGLAAGPAEAGELAVRTRCWLGGGGVVYESGFADRGAQVFKDPEPWPD